MKSTHAAVIVLLATIGAVGVASCGGGTSDTTSPPDATPTTASVSGKVVDTDSANGGVGGVSITIAAAGSAGQSVTTQANGTFLVSSLQPGSYTLSMSAPAGYNLLANETGTRSVTLVASNTATAVTNFQLARTRGAITGSARNAGNALSAASVSLSRPGFTTQNVSTDAFGAFTFAAVPTGPWTVSLPAPSGLRGVGGESGSRSVVVNANATTTVSAFTFEPVPASSLMEIHISGASFSPTSLTVPAGTTVRWINDDAGSHTITPQNAAQPGVFQRVTFGGSTGVVLEHTFGTAGQIYRYRCELHSDNFTAGMVGQVVVQ